MGHGRDAALRLGAMTDKVAVRLDAAFVMAVTGAALIVPWLALIVGAVFLVGNAILIDRRTPPEVVESPPT